MDRPQRIPLTLYSKPGCHLCEDVADHLEALSTRWPLDVTVADITRDLELHRQYWDKIPVVVIGATTLQAPMTLDALRQALNDYQPTSTDHD